MGTEAQCAVRVSGGRHQGKAQLESAEIVFRAPACRLRIAFGEIRAVTAGMGELRVKTKDGLAVFELGRAAELWREKILHPKSRSEKLGLAAGVRVFVSCGFDGEFHRELQRADVEEKKSAREAELIFLAARERAELAELARIARGMRGATALWVVYPKGRKELSQNDVIRAGREAGLKDLKVVAFSRTHTGLKFVIPVERR